MSDVAPRMYPEELQQVEQPPGSHRIRHVCFTLNNYDGTEIEKMKAWGQISYCVVGHEVGAQGTPHLQGYMEFKQQVLLSTAKNKISSKFHIAERRGTPQQAKDYAIKDGNNVHEWGVMSQQGKRTDLMIACELITGGSRLKEVATQHPDTFVKFHKGLKALQTVLIEPRNEVPEVIVYYGETGTGKSHTARLETEDPYVWGPEQEKWFDGYEGQKHVIFEEFRGQLQFGQMLRLLDRYDCKVQYKGGMCEFAATKIIITSPVHPSQWYKCLGEEEGKLDQLLRRITRVVHLHKPFKCKRDPG